MLKVMPKKELLRQVNLFLSDEGRGISVDLFAEICGLHPNTIRNVFQYRTDTLTEYVQRRVSKGYEAWRRGEIAVMQNRDRTRFAEFRRKAEPNLARSSSLQVVNGEIKLKIGVRNRNDYSGKTLDEMLKRG